MISLRSSLNMFVVCVVLIFLQTVQCADFIFGGEAERVCEAYKLICPAKKVCALQSIEWPRTMKFPVCVHDTHIVVKSNICRKPPIPGKCKARFMRWYFNVHMGACSWFTYSGCGGNQNKFRTAEECERRCMGTSKEDLAETMLYTQDRRQDENALTVNEDEMDEDREPKRITAPAKAPEIIELDTGIKASLQLSTTANSTTTTRRDQQRRRKKERERRRQQKNKRKRKNRKNRVNHTTEKDKLSATEPTRELSSLELGPNFVQRPSTPANQAEDPKFAEFRSSHTTVSRFGNSDREDRLFWIMDRQFRRRRRRHPKGLKDHETRSHGSTRSPSSGAKQDTYYDKVKLFDILKKEDEKDSKQM